MKTRGKKIILVMVFMFTVFGLNAYTRSTAEYGLGYRTVKDKAETGGRRFLQ